MSIASEISRLQNAKVNLRSALADAYGTSIPESALVDTWPQYLVPAGCYTTPPQQNGVYIKYSDNTYTDSTILWSGKTPMGVALKTSACSFTIHPSEFYGAWSSYNYVISGCATATDHAGTILDFAGQANTAAIINSGYAGAAVSNAYNATYSNGARGWLPSGGEMNQIVLNATEINSALSAIGGTSLLLGSRSYWVSTQDESGAYARMYNCYASQFYGNEKKYSQYSRSITTF